MDQALQNLLALLVQAQALVSQVISERSWLLAQLSAAASQREAALAQASTLIRENADMSAKLSELAPSDGSVPLAEFKRRLAPFYFVLGSQSDEVQRRWDRVLGLLDSYKFIEPTRDPVKSLIAAAVASGLLTKEQGEALAAPVLRV